MDDCIFCKIIRGEIPGSKVYEDDLVLAIQAEHINESTFLVEEPSPRRLRELSARMRQPLAPPKRPFPPRRHRKSWKG